MNENEVLKALSTVQEPDLKKDLVTLNMVRDIQINGDNISFTVVLTTPACPLKELIASDCVKAIKNFNERANVTVNFESSTTTIRADKSTVLPGVKNIIAVVSGKGLEMVITLGTGFGTALLKDGKLLPHLEIGQHPIKTNRTYDEYIGQKAFENKGKAHWNERLKKVINILKTVYNYDRLYISGGNAKNIDFKLDDNIAIANNRDGIKGGALLWKE